MGGRVTYLMAAALLQFKAAVAYYGGNIMVPWGDGVVALFARTSEMDCPLMFRFGEEDTNPSPEEALVGFQGRGLNHVVQPHFCVPHPP